MKPEVAVFTKANPCTKRELWACFKRAASGFATVQVGQAHAIIGMNAPRVMERNGYLEKVSKPAGDYYKLTQAGQDWLTSGILAYVKNHPSESDSIEFLPGAKTSARRILRKR